MSSSANVQKTKLGVILCSSELLGLANAKGSFWRKDRILARQATSANSKYVEVWRWLLCASTPLARRALTLIKLGGKCYGEVV